MKLEALKEDNSHMGRGGVDCVIQQLHSLDILRKSYKWYKKIFFTLISQCMLNACKVYFHNTNNSITFHQSIHYVIVAMLAALDDIPREADDDSTSRLVSCHFAKQFQRLATKSYRTCQAKKKEASKGQTIKTAFICKTWQPGLHPGKCSKIYHTVLDFKE